MAGNGIRWASAAQCILAISLIGAPVLAFAENLVDVYALALQNDPRYKAARAEAEAAGYGIDEARAGLLPTVTGQIGNIRTGQTIIDSNNPVYASGQSSYPTIDYGVSLTQPVFRQGAWRRYEQAKVVVKQAGATFAVARQDLIMRTATAYFGVLASKDGALLSDAERKAIKKQLDFVQERFNGGLVTSVSLHDARARYLVKESDVIAAANDLDDKQQALTEITGTTITHLAAVPDAIPLVLPEPLDLKRWVDAALARNLSLEARQLTVDIAQAEIARQSAANYPTVDFTASSNRRNTGGSLFGGGSNVRENVFGLRVNIPFTDGGLTSAVTSAAVKRHEAAREDLERDRRQVERQTRASYNGIRSGSERVKALNQSVLSLESARTLKVEGYKAGTMAALAVLDAERDLYAAKRDAAQSRYDYLLNTLRLKQAAGTLAEDDLRLINNMLK